MSAHRRFIQELCRFEKTWSVNATPSEPTIDQDKATWNVIASGPNWRVETEYRQVRWDDVIDASTRTHLWRRTLEGLHAFVDFITAGALIAYLRSNWRYAGFFLYPFFLLALLAAIAGMFGATVGHISGTASVGAVAGAAALAGLMQWPGRRLHLPILFDDWSFSRAYIKSPHPVLDPRLDRMARELVASARRGEAEEIVLVGHSLGAVLAVDLLDRALQLWPHLGRSGTRMIFVSVGSSILKIGLHQGASRFRAALQRVAAAPGVVWGEYQALTDVMNFYKTNPISSLGLKGTSPVVRLVRIRRMLDPSVTGTLGGTSFVCIVNSFGPMTVAARMTISCCCVVPCPLRRRSSLHQERRWPSDRTGDCSVSPTQRRNSFSTQREKSFDHTDDCQGCLRYHGGWLVPYSFPSCSAITPHPGFSQREGRQRDCTAACFTHWPRHPAISIRLQRSFSFRELSIPTNHSVGAPLLAVGALTMFYLTHRALGRNWSVTLEVRQSHKLVTDGIYERVRHPMYTAFWLWALAQALLLPNWIAGLSGIFGFGTLYFLRIRHEECLMIEAFGDRYRSYMARTTRIVPKVF